ncbi:hypothetical protein AVEN_49014-1 [Araneus ventricosus]|uniref:HTH CENPB-type domain-containing protein n=1 Tax=Araneus ventricosus TaxID=182803 RepID=A0A4Y2AGY4_ARAVE|nr:hypothetical protein AVEN_49014-1 [Araneus ventricosus]
MLSKRSITGKNDDSSKKRKHNSLTIFLKKWNCCGSFTLEFWWPIFVQNKYYSSSINVPLAMDKRKTVHKATNEKLVMIEWVRQRCSEKVPLTGGIKMAQVKLYHEDMRIETPCKYSSGWLEKFKKRHGIRQLRICREKAATDIEAAEHFVDISEHGLLLLYKVKKKTTIN